MGGKRIRRAALIGIIALGAAAFGPPAASGAQWSGELTLPEPAAAAISASAMAAGAFGLYLEGGSRYTVVAPAETASRLREVLSGQPADVVASRHSLQDVQSARDAVTGRTWHPEASRFVYATLFDAQQDLLRVLTTAPPEVRNALAVAHPDVVRVESSPRLARTAGFRTLDTAPHYGAATINNGEAICTSSFSVVVGSSRYSATNEHCFRDSGIFAGDPSSGPFFYGNPHRSAPYPTYDFTLLSGSDYAGYIWTGGFEGVKTRVGAAGDPAVGARYCHSGSTSFEECGMQVVSLSESLCDEDGCTHNLAMARGDVAGPGDVANAGDSGGPFYAKTSASAHIRGLIVGSDDETFTVYHKWSTFRDYYGASIIIGS